MADSETAKGESAYVKFLVRDLDARTLRLARKDAYRRKISVSDWLRTILCRHYSLDCPKSRASARKSNGATTFVLRMGPALWQAVRDDSTESGRSMQVIVREILENPYAKKEAVT